MKAFSELFLSDIVQWTLSWMMLCLNIQLLIQFLNAKCWWHTSERTKLNIEAVNKQIVLITEAFWDCPEKNLRVCEHDLQTQWSGLFKLHYWIEVFSFVFLLVLVSKSLVNRFSAEHSELLNHSERMERRSFYTSSSLEDQKRSCLQIWRYGDIKLNIYLAYHFGLWVIWTLAISPRKGFLLPFLANTGHKKVMHFQKFVSNIQILYSLASALIPISIHSYCMIEVPESRMLKDIQNACLYDDWVQFCDA